MAHTVSVRVVVRQERNVALIRYGVLIAVRARSVREILSVVDAVTIAVVAKDNAEGSGAARDVVATLEESEVQ